MSYTLAYKGAEIDEILGRAATGGALDTAIAAKQDALTFDAVPTEGSTNPAESGGIYDAIQAGGAAALAAFATDSVSGDVVSFPDGADSIPVKSFTGSIIPQQNLNGQSAPYPAGGGKNKINSEATSATHNGVTYTVNADYTISTSGTATGGLSVKNIINGKTLAQANLVEGTSYILNGCPSGGSASGYYLRLALTTSGGTTNYTDTGSGVSFTVPSGVTGVRIYIGVSVGVSANNLVFKPMIRLSSVTDATFAPYANVCPISGWTGASLFRMGANLFNAATATKDKFVDANGVIGTSVGVWSLSDYIPVKAGQTYTTIGGTTPSGPCNCFYDAEKNFLSSLPVATRTFTVPDGAYFVRLSFRLNATLATEGALCLGASASWSAYQGSTILLSFGQTVYAGTLTALGGGLWEIQPTTGIVDLGTRTWGYNSTYGFYENEFSSLANGSVADGYLWCESYQPVDGVANAQMPSKPDMSICHVNKYIKVKDSRYTDGTAFKSAVNGVMLCYPLATLPDPITITGEDLQTLLGANTVWQSTGSITSLEYRADTALYIQKLLNGGGTLQTLSMASPSPSLSLGRVGVLAEPEVSEPEQTDEEAEQLEQTEEPEQTEEE